MNNNELYSRYIYEKNTEKIQNKKNSFQWRHCHIEPDRGRKAGAAVGNGRNWQNARNGRRKTSQLEKWNNQNVANGLLNKVLFSHFRYWATLIRQMAAEGRCGAYLRSIRHPLIRRLIKNILFFPLRFAFVTEELRTKYCWVRACRFLMIIGVLFRRVKSLFETAIETRIDFLIQHSPLHLTFYRINLICDKNWKAHESIVFVALSRLVFKLIELNSECN